MAYKKIILACLGILLLGGVIWVLSREPSHDRDWEMGLEELPSFEQQGNILTVKNFRNFDWLSETEAIERYETRQFDLATLNGVDIFISHFSSFEGMAHIFLSFQFTDREPLVISIETRREAGEVYSPFWGMLRQYELIYLAGSERDMVGLRTDIRKDRVYLYPTVASGDEARALLLRLVKKVNALEQEPRFYNTLFANCTNLITREVEQMSPVEFPLTWKTLLPGYFDDVLFELGLVQGDGKKETYRIDNAKVDRHSPNYSKELRMH